LLIVFPLVYHNPANIKKIFKIAGFISQISCFNISYLCAKIEGLGRIVAIDYGTKRTGLAVTDPGQMIASPLETVATHELMNYLESYFAREDVETLVVGHPVNLDHTDSGSMRPVRFFVQAFKKRFPAIRVEWMDERFTSKMAMDAMVEGGMKKSGRREKGIVDRVSAALILQSWMERANNLRR
jgi:putative Holliday junction resolvase